MNHHYLITKARNLKVTHIPPSPYPPNITHSQIQSTSSPKSISNAPASATLAHHLSPELQQQLPSWPSGILRPPTTPHSSSQSGHRKCTSSHVTHTPVHTLDTLQGLGTETSLGLQSMQSLMSAP